MKQLAVALAIVGGVLAIVAAGAVWATVLEPQAPPLPDVSHDVRGGDLVPGVRSLGLLALAGSVAVLAAPPRARRLVGAVLLASGCGVIWLAAASPGSAAVTEQAQQAAGVMGVVTPTLWPWAGVVAGALLALSGLLVLLRGHRWPGLSTAYRPPAARPAESVTDKGVWDALDRGEDPTR